MSKVDLWNRAADAMREDADARWHAVADWLRGEAWAAQSMEPFVDLLNSAMEQKSGIKSYLRFGRKSDGEVALLADTNEGATAVALAYLAPNPTPTPAAVARATESAAVGGAGLEESA